MARREGAVDPQLSGAQTRSSRTAPVRGRRLQRQGDIAMGKYLVGWLLGVPVFVLVILYFFFH